MPCPNYSNFYMTLPIAILTIISIFGIYLIYLLQQYNSQLRDLHNSIANLKTKMSHFADLTTSVVPWIHMPKLSERSKIAGESYREILNVSSEELGKLELELIEEYNKYNRTQIHGKDDYKRVLIALERLQRSIYSKYLYVNEYFLYGPSEITLNEFKSWMSKFRPFSEEIDGIYTGIYSLIGPITAIYLEKKYKWYPNIGEDNINNLIRYYNSFFEEFKKIKDLANNIDSEVDHFYKNWFNGILASHKSILASIFGVIIIVLFGLMLPLYLLQPNNINWISCETVFYINTFFIFVGIPISFVAAYMLRYKPQ